MSEKWDMYGVPCVSTNLLVMRDQGTMIALRTFGTWEEAMAAAMKDPDVYVIYELRRAGEVSRHAQVTDIRSKS